MVNYSLCICKDCGKESMIKEDAEWRCLHCGGTRLELKETILKDVGRP